MKTPARKSTKKTKPKNGADLFQQVVRLTGIPQKQLKQELKGILDRNHIDLKDLTIDQLRAAAASYLREIMGGILDRCSHKKGESHH